MQSIAVERAPLERHLNTYFPARPRPWQLGLDVEVARQRPFVQVLDLCPDVRRLGALGRRLPLEPSIGCGRSGYERFEAT